MEETLINSKTTGSGWIEEKRTSGMEAVTRGMALGTGMGRSLGTLQEMGSCLTGCHRFC